MANRPRDEVEKIKSEMCRLMRRGATVRDLEKVCGARRTVYDYLSRLADDGVSIVRLGTSRPSVFMIQ